MNRRLKKIMLFVLVVTVPLVVWTINKKIEANREWYVVESVNVPIESVRFSGEEFGEPNVMINTKEGTYRTNFENVHHVVVTEEKPHFRVQVYGYSKGTPDENHSTFFSEDEKVVLTLFLDEKDAISLSSEYVEKYKKSFLFDRSDRIQEDFEEASSTDLIGSTWKAVLFDIRD